MILKIYNNYTINILAAIFFLSMISCKINATYENREEDRAEAEISIREFYKHLKSNEFANTYILFTNRFFTVTDTAKLLLLYHKIVKECGKVRGYSLNNWKTTIVKGTKPSAEYVFLYSVRRDKCITKETITLKKEKDIVRIASYDVKAY
jgi:hypothetical protein